MFRLNLKIAQKFDKVKLTHFTFVHWSHSNYHLYIVFLALALDRWPISHVAWRERQQRLSRVLIIFEIADFWAVKKIFIVWIKFDLWCLVRQLELRKVLAFFHLALNRRLSELFVLICLRDRGTTLYSFISSELIQDRHLELIYHWILTCSLSWDGDPEDSTFAQLLAWSRLNCFCTWPYRRYSIKDWLWLLRCSQVFVLTVH